MPQANPIARAYISLEERALHWTATLATKLGLVPARATHLLTGERGETAALFYLRRNGYIITAQRWGSARYKGDIDLIGWDGDTLCFIEVKTRTTRDEAFTADSAVNQQKRQILRRLALLYAKQTGRNPTRLRFDIVSVYAVPGEAASIELLKGAFPLRGEA